MPSISYPTSLSIPGPWILDARNLKDLDELIDSCWATMQERRQTLVESALAELRTKHQEDGITPEKCATLEPAWRKSIEDEYPLRTQRRKVIAYLSGGRSAAGESFAELIPLASAHEEVPRGFSLSIEVARTELSVEATNTYSDRLNLSVETSSDEPALAQELFGKLQNWATEIRPKKWLQKWLDLQWLFPVFLFLNLLAIVVALTYTLTPIPAVDEPGPLHREAWDLIKGGVTTANEPKAVEILLALESDYHTAPTAPVRITHRVLGFRIWLYLGLSLIAIAAFSRPPKGAVGLWEGKHQAELQRKWIKVVSVSVPGLIVTYALVPLLVNLLGWSK